MSTSYQAIDVRLVGVENALMFLMQTMRVKQMVSSPLDPNPKVVEMSLWDFYRQQLALGLLEQVKENGSDDAADNGTSPDAGSDSLGADAGSESGSTD